MWKLISMRETALANFGKVVLVLLTLDCTAITVTPTQAQTQSQPQTQPATAPPTTKSPDAAPAKSFLPPRAAVSGATGAPAAAPPNGVTARLYRWLAEQQRHFIGRLAAALRDIKSGNWFSASLVLIGFSFLYGILHSAGPGHGKAIVSSYILADGQTVRRGIQLAFLSAFVQALTAILIFAIVVVVLHGARTQIANTETWLERMSWLIVALFGAMLLFRQLRALVTGRSPHDHAHHHHAGHALARAHAAPAHAHDHAPAHDYAHGAHSHQNHDHAHDHAHHDHHAHGAGETCSTCGHAHMPTADSLKGEWSWSRAGALALAIGIRPCTGAIGVLFVANGLGLMWAGIASTFAMAIGTAITVSALAAMAASSRDAATSLAGVADNSWASRAQTAFGIGGAALVFALGSMFFYYSLGSTAPF